MVGYRGCAGVTKSRDSNRSPFWVDIKWITMVKNCCVVGCSNVYKKNSGIHFYRFPCDKNKRSKCIAAVRREEWLSNANTWICSQHFVTVEKCNNPLAPNYVPLIFPNTRSPVKRKIERDAERFEQRQGTKRRRLMSTKKSNVEKA